MSFKLITCIVDRANYGRLLPLLKVLQADARFDSLACFTGTTLFKSYNLLNTERYTEHGIYADFEIHIEMSTGTHSAMTETISNGVLNISKLFADEKPNAVVVIGDRYEALSCAIAAAYTNTYLIHIQGGELSGSIDETTRHCITKMAHLHFPATQKAASVIRHLGEDPRSIHVSGCPVSEVLNHQSVPIHDILSKYSISVPFKDLISKQKIYAVSILHPVTTDVENTSSIAAITAELLNYHKIPTLWILPNSDPGKLDVTRSIPVSEYIEKVQNIEPVDFQSLISGAHFLIGNSSSFIRDSSLYGVPVINLGKRQQCREHGPNVSSIIEPSYELISNAIKTAINSSERVCSDIYKGVGKSPSIIIADEIYKFLTKPFYDGYQKKFCHLRI